MQPVKPKKQITVRLGEDFNWWLAPTPDDVPGEESPDHGVLDPRQVRHVLDALEQHRPFGADPNLFGESFRFYAIQAELGEGVVQLEVADADGDGDLFALPVIDDENDGPYFDFLDALSAARIRRLNATHEYAHGCTVEEMQEELDALDSDRYFSDERIHAFDEINEILEWSPAEWDQS
jgi:hypothetical protein